ncbi:MAG: diguanylate cyclase [candidate division WOR-3 bacterium]
MNNRYGELDFVSILVVTDESRKIKFSVPQDLRISSVMDLFPEDNRDKVRELERSLSDEGYKSTDEVLCFWGNRYREAFLEIVRVGGYILYKISIIPSIFLSKELLTLSDMYLENLRRLSQDARNIALKKDGEISNLLEQVSLLNQMILELQRELLKKNFELQELSNKLKEISIRDELTGLYNRRYLKDRFYEELARIGRGIYKGISLVYIDLNNFKRFNDNFGHEFGDEILKRFAEALRRFTRRNIDVPFRIGGDEFALIVINCEDICVPKVMERIQDYCIRECYGLRFSFGTKIIETPDADLEDCLRDADKAMFENKRSKKSSSS